MTPGQELAAFVNQFFAYAHLPERLQPVSKPFHDLARQVLERCDPDDLLSLDQTREALRNLLRAKDCAVRAALIATSTA